MPAPYSRILRRHFHCNGVNNMELKSIVGPITTPDLMAGAHGPTEVVNLWEEASRIGDPESYPLPILNIFVPHTGQTP